MADLQGEAQERVVLLAETKVGILQLKETVEDLLPEHQVVEQPMQADLLVTQADKDMQ
tara:strand:+ start:726 stop:899 length:174 start_codon:yes stop_codon:yes gene_type:complete